MPNMPMPQQAGLGQSMMVPGQQPQQPQQQPQVPQGLMQWIAQALQGAGPQVRQQAEQRFAGGMKDSGQTLDHMRGQNQQHADWLANWDKERKQNEMLLQQLMAQQGGANGR